jgi:hypothetical protein
LKLLAVDTVTGPGDGLQASGLNRFTAMDTDTVLVGIHPFQSVIDPSQDISFTG